MDKLDILKKILELGFSIRNISEKTKIPEQRIYKWKAKKGSPKLEDYTTLLKFYDDMKPQPTLDFVSGKIKSDDGTSVDIESMRERIKEHKLIIEMQKAEIERLQEELDKKKAPVVTGKEKKTGG